MVKEADSQTNVYGCRQECDVPSNTAPWTLLAVVVDIGDCTNKEFFIYWDDEMQNIKYFDLRQLRIIVELRVDVVNVAVQEEGEGGNVLEADKVRRGAYDAGEHEELVELVVADCKCMALSFCGSLCRRIARD